MTTSPNCNTRRERVMGIALHYTAGGYGGSVAWCCDPVSKVSYHTVIGPNAGERAAIVPYANRAWHMGVCRSSDPQRLPYRDANNVFIGIGAATGTTPAPVTPDQFAAIVAECRAVFAAYQWPLTDTWRIVGHDTEAWPRGRKTDPTGHDAAAPILSVVAVRAALQAP